MFIGFSFSWSALFFVLKRISGDIAYNSKGEIRSELGLYIYAYLFETMFVLWALLVVVMVGYHWRQLIKILQNQEDEAKQKKNEMMAYLAHDLRTPLTSIIGYSKLMDNMESLDNQKAREYLRIILDKSEALDNMLEEFFEIAKLETGNIKLSLIEINLAEMLKQLVSEYMPILNEKNLKINCQIIAEARVLCDVSKIERVFDNMMRNAIKYTNNQGSIHIRGYQETSRFHMVFSNEAQPISESQLENMFDSFVRLEEARNEVEGAGMGLAIVKEIIELHKGKVWAEYHFPYLEIHILLNIIKLS